MHIQQFRQAYREARQGIVNDTLESIAAILSIEERKKVDNIGMSFQFVLTLKGGLKERPTRRNRSRQIYSDAVINELCKIDY